MTKARTLADNFAADINAITASTPLTGGGTSGTVTVSIQDGTTSQKGAVQLEDSTASTSTTKASTPNSVKSAYDLANGAIAKSLVDAKGDLLVGSANDTVSRLTVASTAGYLLSVDSAESTGLKWAAPASGGSLTLLSTTTLTGTSNSITIAPTGYVNLLVLFREVHAASNNGTFFGRFNADTGSNHIYGQWRKYMGGAGDFQVPQNQSSFEITNQLGTSSAYQSALSGSMDVFRVTDTSKIAFECRVFNFNDSSQAGWYHTYGNYNASAAITNLTLFGSQNLSGTVYIYGVK